MPRAKVVLTEVLVYILNARFWILPQLRNNGVVYRIVLAGCQQNDRHSK